MDIFKKLFSALESLHQNKLDETEDKVLDLEKQFGLASKMMEFDEIEEKDKAKFIVILVTQYNLLKERNAGIEQRRLAQLRLEQEQEILR